MSALQVGFLKGQLERKDAEIERLWDVLSWIDTFDPETTAAAEDKFKFILSTRSFEQAPEGDGSSK